MPFRKARKGYVSTHGKHYTARQVRAYYATRGWRQKPRRKGRK
jgi:hypothetical protein